MRRRLVLLTLTLSLSAALGCAPRARTDATPPPAGAPAVSSLRHGLWSGTAVRSPLGKQPYAIEFRKEGDEIVGETPPTLGEEVLPPGAYQKFRFTKNAAGAARVVYKTAMGERGLLDGELELDGTRSSASREIYCEPSACESMELRWEALDEKKMSFQVWLDGGLHADMVLEFEGDP